MKFISRIHCGIPGHTTHSADHARNSWVYSNHATITSVLCTRKLPGYGVTFVCMLTYLANLRALPKVAGKKEDCAVLQYSGVPKIRESKALLVRNCSKKLEEYSLTLWVVSIVLYIQESQA